MKADEIRAIYDLVGAPDWASPNLDGLADVLRDLSWLPQGPVSIPLPDDPAVADVVRRALVESAHSGRPVRLSTR